MEDISVRDLKKMDPAVVCRQLGGQKFGENDWRIPDLCKGERELGDNPGFTLFMKKGEMCWSCHRCEDGQAATQALLEALGMGSERSLNAGKLDTTGSGREPVNIKNLGNMLNRLMELYPKHRCILCNVEDSLWIFGVNGWPVFLCCSCSYAYKDYLNRAVELCGPDSYRFQTRYYCENGKVLFSNRVEPGKIITGLGSNRENNPKVLKWAIEENDNWAATSPEPNIICEGEKAAAALVQTGYQAWSWRGGKSQWRYTDFRNLEEVDEVILWPDDHPDGRRAMLQVADQLIEKFPTLSISFVQNNGRTNDDAADFDSTTVIRMIEEATDYDIFSDHVDSERDEHSDEKSERSLQGDDDDLPEEWWTRDDGLSDIRRLFHFAGENQYAYIWEPGISSESPSLMVADNVGYWHRLGRTLGRARDFGRMNALVQEAREHAIDRARVVYEGKQLEKIVNRLERGIDARQQGNIMVHLSTLYHKGNAENLPEFGSDQAIQCRDAGLLTLRHQCVEMATGRNLNREEVMALGLTYDPGWSPYRWKPGAYENTDDEHVRNVQRLVGNVGDTMLVIAEMVMKMDRRIAVLKSTTSGRGKSVLARLMEKSLGSLVGRGEASDLHDRSLGRQFPAANNSHARHRIVIYSEADKPRLDRLNLGQLVYLTGEASFSTEEKFEQRIARERLGNPFLIMGEWVKEDKKTGPMIDWDIQGMFDRHRQRGRLWAYDMDKEDSEFLGDYVYYSTFSDSACEAFIDKLVQIGMEHEGPPEIFTPRVLEYVNDLLDFGKDYEGSDSPRKKDLHFERRTYAEGLFEETDNTDIFYHTSSLVQMINEACEVRGWPEVAGTDREWFRAIRDVFSSVPSLSDPTNESLVDPVSGMRRKPLRGVILLEG